MTTIASEPYVVIGNYRDVWGKDNLVGVPMSDLTTHTCVSGSTGSGKSTFLRSMAKQFFDLGGVVIVIEPHGDLILDPAEGILADLPPDRLDRVAVLDFAGPGPPQLNLTAVRLVNPSQKIEHRCFSGSIRTNQTVEPASRKSQRKLLHSFQTAERNANLVDVQQSFLSRHLCGRRSIHVCVPSATDEPSD